MKVERILDWQVANEEGEWEPVEGLGNTMGGRTPAGGREAEGRGRIVAKPRLPRWAWGALLMVLAMLAMGATLRLHRRYQEALRRVAFQIQSVIDLEARALEQGDADLYLAQQDEAATAWYAQQKMRVGADGAQPGSAMRGRW